MRLSLMAAICLSMLMAIFAVQNSQQTHITFLGWHSEGPLVIVLLLSFTAGVISAMLATLPGAVSRRREISKLKSRVAEDTGKIESLEKQAESRIQNGEQKTADETTSTTP